MGNRNLEVVPVDNPELYRMESPASTRWVKPRSLKNRGVLDHHFLEKIPRGILWEYLNHFAFTAMLTESYWVATQSITYTWNVLQPFQRESIEQICLVNKAGGVEVADVRKNLLKLRFFQAHPLSNWQHKILEGKLGNQTSTTSILFCSRKQRLWKRIEDLATLDASTSNDIVSSPSMISPSTTVRGQGPSKVWMSHHHHWLKQILGFHLCHKLFEAVIHRIKSPRQFSANIAMIVKATKLDKEKVPFNSPLSPLVAQVFLNQFLWKIHTRCGKHVVHVWNNRETKSRSKRRCFYNLLLF